jgi:hypothetical protein
LDARINGRFAGANLAHADLYGVGAIAYELLAGP